MQRPSRVAFTPGVLVLHPGEFYQFSDGHGPRLTLGDRRVDISNSGDRVYDLAVAEDRVVALHDGHRAQHAYSVMTLELATPMTTPIDRAFERIAITSEALFAANGDEAIELATHRTIANAPIGMAVSHDRLAVLDPSGIAFFDATGKRLAHTPLFAPTAIAADPIEPGWLVAIDGGVFHVAGPDAIPRLVVACDVPVLKVRRSASAVYVVVSTAVSKTLREIAGERQRDIYTLDDKKLRWSDFDAGVGGLHVCDAKAIAT